MSLIIKMDAIKTKEHLRKSIPYIFNERKTDGLYFSNAGVTPEQILEEILGDFGLEISDKIPAAFECDCSKERVSRAISTLSKKDLDSIINDGEAIEVKCQFCNKAYHFDIDELKEMRK